MKTFDELFAELSAKVAAADPSSGTVQAVRDGVHAGSTAVRDFIAAEQPEYLFCGHIHEAAGSSETFVKTTAVNVGKKGYLLELD